MLLFPLLPLGRAARCPLPPPWRSEPCARARLLQHADAPFPFSPRPQIQIGHTLKIARLVGLEAAKRKVKAYVRIQHPFYQCKDSGSHDEKEEVKPEGVIGTWWHETLRTLGAIEECVPFFHLGLSCALTCRRVAASTSSSSEQHCRMGRTSTISVSVVLVTLLAVIKLSAHSYGAFHRSSGMLRTPQAAYESIVGIPLHERCIRR